MALSEAVVDITGDFSGLARQASTGGNEAGSVAGEAFVRQFEGIVGSDTDIHISADTSEAIRDLAGVERELRPLTEEERAVLIDAEVAAAQRKIREIDRQLENELEDEEVRVLLDQRGEATRKINELTRETDDLEDSLEGAADAGSSLGSVLAGIGFAAVARGLFEIADGASELEQAVGGTETLFGSAASTIDDFAETSAAAFGLSAREARTLTSQLGGLLRGFDYTRDAAATTSVEIAKLGADLAAAYGGSVTDAVDALGAALRGEFNPLERFGVAMNVAQIEAYALEKGLAATKSEIDLSTRAMAALSLIQERTTDIQGQFTRELTTAGGVMSTTRAVMAGLADEAGEALLPGLIAMSESLRDDVAPSLFELANAAFPLITTALEAFAPLMGSTTALLTAATPLFEALGTVLEGIPQPILTAATAFLTLQTAMKLVNFSGTITGLLGLSKGAAAASTSTGLLARGIGLIRAHPIAAATVAVAGLTTAILTSEDGWDGFSAKIEDSVVGLLGFETSAERAAKITAQLTEGLDIGSFEGMREAVENIESLNRAIESNDKWADAIKDSREYRESILPLTETLKQNAIEQLNSATASGALTDELQHQVNALALADAGYEEWVALLGRATPAIQEHERRVAGIVEEYSDLTSVAKLSADGVSNLLHESGDASVALLNLKAGAGDTETQLLNLAVAAGNGAIETENMADLAAMLGVEMESLEGFIESVNGAIDNFASQALSSLPDISDAFRDMNEDGKISVNDLVQALREDTEMLTQFQSNLETISTAVGGKYTEIAALLAQQGPIANQAAAELATAITEGNLEVVNDVLSTVESANAAYDSMEEYLRTELGPRFILTSGLLGSAATAAFGDGLTFSQRIDLAGRLAQLEMSEEGKAIAAIAATEGSQAARDYGRMLDLDQKVIEEGVKAGNALRNIDTSGASAGGASTGSAFAQGVTAGMLGAKWGVLAQARSIANEARNIINSVWGVSSPAKVTMYSGRMFSEGLAIGIEEEGKAVVAAAEQIAKDAVGGLGVDSAHMGLAASGVLSYGPLAPAGPDLAPRQFAAAPAMSSGVASVNDRALAETIVSALASRPNVIEFNVGRSDELIAAIVKELRKEIAVSGGNVQSYLGSTR